MAKILQLMLAEREFVGIEVVVCVVQWLSHADSARMEGSRRAKLRDRGYWGPDVAGASAAHGWGQ